MKAHQTKQRLYEYNQYSTIKLEEFIFIELEKHLLNDEAILDLRKKLNKRLKTKFYDNKEMLANIRNKL